MLYVVQSRYKHKGLWEGWSTVFADQKPVLLHEGQQIPKQFQPQTDDEEFQFIPLQEIGVL